MAVYESGYPSLIQGASQQVPDKRLDGQVSNQLNMVSDALTGLRRRKGFELLRFLENSMMLGSGGSVSQVHHI